MSQITASFASDGSAVVTAPNGGLTRGETVDHMDRLREELYEVADGVWCMVGNGLSNQTFVLGPEGLIVIDTGESQEEMTAALTAVRASTDAPVAAVIYTHFHYCNGTAAILAENVIDGDIPIWGHERIDDNLTRTATEVATAGGRGLVHQFGMRLPNEGPDALVGGGLGRFYRNPAHGRGTDGYLRATDLIGEPTTARIAGLQVDFTPAPSDADDNVNIFFPELGLCVNNLVWPALFNVFAIRGEEYRDPRVLLAGFDEIIDFDPEHLVCAHGPPLSGRSEIRAGVTDARDAVQFLWDQTVRGINRGLTLGELIAQVQLPERFERSYLTQQHYGLAEHHVRQIHSGLRGWFDGYEAELFPLPTLERTARLIDGFGGRPAVLNAAREALQSDDLRWALELATWLVRSELAADGRADGGSAEERSMLASALRAIAQRTTSANNRNWCLTRALELDGEINLSNLRGFRVSRGQVLSRDPATFVHALKVVLEPARAVGLHAHLGFDFGEGIAAGLQIRDGVAVPTDGAGAEYLLTMALETWAEIVSARATLTEAIADGRVAISGDATAAQTAMACFDHPSFT